MADTASPLTYARRIPALPSVAAAHVRRLLPGVLLCLIVTGAAFALAAAEERLFGAAWLEALVLAILLGTAIRSIWTPSPGWSAGIGFSAKPLLEVAVTLLGASVSAATILAVGPMLLIGTAVVVAVAIAASFAIGRMLGLPQRMAILVACGNAICGNSAIAAVAPVIDADSDDVAASIAFTAVLGVAVVLGLPLIGIALQLSAAQYGVFAGLTVYAVPQVIAAAAPMGHVAIQIGTLVKLVRVLMLAPVCVLMAVIAPRLDARGGASMTNDIDRRVSGRLQLHHFVPWFIIGFFCLAAARSFDLIPHFLLSPVSAVATFLTVMAMAALGLGVDVRTVAKAGGPVTAAVILSLVVLAAIALVLIRLVGAA